MTTEKQLIARTVKSIRPVLRAARTLRDALFEWGDTVNVIEEDALDVEGSDFDPGLWLEKESGLQWSTPLVGDPCWATWQDGEEFYLALDKLVDAMEKVIDSQRRDR